MIKTGDDWLPVQKGELIVMFLVNCQWEKINNLSKRALISI